jgi:hypothetical protein
MSKSTNHEADQTVKFHVSIKEWDDMYDENNKTFDNYHGLLHQRLYEKIEGIFMFIKFILFLKKS